MTVKPQNVTPQSSPTDELRSRAEKDPRATADTDLPATSAAETAHLVHELQVHQIELEMQNEALSEAQTALQQSQARYFELYELAPAGYLTLNEKGLIIEANLTAAQLLGVKKSALVNRSFSQFVVPEHQSSYYACFRQLLADGKKHACEFCMLGADGIQFWAALDANIMKNEAGGITLIRCMVSDITQRKQSEQLQHEAEERLELAMEASGEGLWDWDIQNNRVIHSRKWYELLGLDANNKDQGIEFYTTLLHPDDRAAVLLMLRRAINEEGGFQSKHRLRRSDGHYLWILEKGIVVKRNAAGNPLRMVGIFIDISERKQAERQQRELQKHYERLLKLQVVNQTIAAIAHELNQPLSAAASYTDAVLNLLRKEKTVPGKVMSTLHQVTKQIQRAGAVVHDLFRVLHAGETLTKPVDLNRMVRTVIDKLKEDAHILGFRTELDLAEGLPKVSVNTLQLEMVLTNLLRNAIEAMENDGQSAGSILIIVRTDDSGTCAHLSIQDTGPGVPGEKLDSIFQPFASSKSHGLGMGLAISRALIEAQGGHLWCQSDAGSGATFHLTLPYINETTP